MLGLATERLRFNKLVLNVASWVSSAVARRVELWDDTLVIPPTLAARAAVLAFGGELLDLKLRNDGGSQWFSKGGKKMTAAAWFSKDGRNMAAAQLERLIKGDECVGAIKGTYTAL
jgi:hypothetical protein